MYFPICTGSCKFNISVVTHDQMRYLYCSRYALFYSIENFVYTMAKFDVSSCTIMVCVSDPLCMKLCAESSFPCYDYQHSDYHPVRMLYPKQCCVLQLVTLFNFFARCETNSLSCHFSLYCTLFVLRTERAVAFGVGTDRRTEAFASAQSTREGGKCWLLCLNYHACGCDKVFTLLVTVVVVNSLCYIQLFCFNTDVAIVLSVQ